MAVAVGSLHAHRAVVDVDASFCVCAGGKVLGRISMLGNVLGTAGSVCQEYIV